LDWIIESRRIWIRTYSFYISPHFLLHFPFHSSTFTRCLAFLSAHKRVRWESSTGFEAALVLRLERRLRADVFSSRRSFLDTALVVQ